MWPSVSLTICWLSCVSFSVVAFVEYQTAIETSALTWVFCYLTLIYLSLWIGTILIELLDFSNNPWILEKQYLQHYSFFCYRLLWWYWTLSASVRTLEFFSSISEECCGCFGRECIQSVCCFRWNGHFHNIKSMFIVSHEHMSFHFLVLCNWSG